MQPNRSAHPANPPQGRSHVSLPGPGKEGRKFAALLWLVLLSLVSACAQKPAGPVLVELFTSEGCSSCPPADALLARIAREDPDAIVLSEHVTYWNQLGWRDPYSLDASTARQTDYAARLHLEGPYTPQMVVGGQEEFVGSDRGRLVRSLAAAHADTRPALTLERQAGSPPSTLLLKVHLQKALPGADLIAVLVENEGHQQVARGENGGRTLHHVSIARSFQELGRSGPDGSFEGEAKFTLPAGASAAGFHAVVFAQAGRGGRVLAAAATP